MAWLLAKLLDHPGSRRRRVFYRGSEHEEPLPDKAASLLPESCILLTGQPGSWLQFMGPLSTQRWPARVHWGPGTPRLAVRLSRGPDHQVDTTGIGEGTPHGRALARCDAWLEISFDDLDEVLDESNTLIETQLTLQDATGGFMFNTWNGTLSAYEPDQD